MEKFTKANAYKFLNELTEELLEVGQDGQLVKTIDEIKLGFKNAIEDNFKPQSGGGASKNPSYLNEDEDSVYYGSMMHYCRFKQCYMPESEMNMHNGASKGASKYAAKHDYEIGKQVDKLRADALSAFVAGDYTTGADKNIEADKLDASRSNPETYCDENLEQYREADRLKEEAKKAESTTTNDETNTNDGEV